MGMHIRTQHMTDTAISYWTHRIRDNPTAAAAAAVALGGSLTILGAWFFQFVVRLKPCPLCYEQRYAYYFAIPLAVLLLMGGSVGASRKVLVVGLIAIAALMLWNAGLGAYHAGVEWKLWAGPRDCSGPLEDLSAGGSLLNQLQSISIVRCDDAPWRFLGLSLAGYNVLISLALAGAALWGAAAGWHKADAER